MATAAAVTTTVPAPGLAAAAPAPAAPAAAPLSAPVPAAWSATGCPDGTSGRLPGAGPRPAGPALPHAPLPPLPRPACGPEDLLAGNPPIGSIPSKSKSATDHGFSPCSRTPRKSTPDPAIPSSSSPLLLPPPPPAPCCSPSASASASASTFTKPCTCRRWFRSCTIQLTTPLRAFSSAAMKWCGMTGRPPAAGLAAGWPLARVYLSTRRGTHSRPTAFTASGWVWPAAGQGVPSRRGSEAPCMARQDQTAGYCFWYNRRMTQGSVEARV